MKLRVLAALAAAIFGLTFAAPTVLAADEAIDPASETSAPVDTTVTDEPALIDEPASTDEPVVGDDAGAVVGEENQRAVTMAAPMAAEADESSDSNPFMPALLGLAVVGGVVYVIGQKKKAQQA